MLVSVFLKNTFNICIHCWLLTGILITNLLLLMPVKKIASLLVLGSLISGFLRTADAQKPRHPLPNIIIVYVDDLGYGDVGCYGATTVQTPAVDYLAAHGLRFTDGHSTAATCTPSRYSLLTGSYAFRNNATILPGDAPLLINPSTPTLPHMLKRAGYATGVIGKWHLGLGDGFINWNKVIRPGPLELGFDYSFIVPATLDRVPCVYVEGRRVVNLDPLDPIRVDYVKKIGSYPVGLEEPQALKVGADSQHSNTIINGISRIGYMDGGKSALWVDEEMPFVFLNKVDTFLQQHQQSPFFLYFSFTDIHVPRSPNIQFKNKTAMGSRGDNIVQMDWTVGELIKKLRKLNLEKNTLLIFTSDNGPVLDDGYDDKAASLLGPHQPSGKYSGGKYSAFEAGTRVPTIVYWPDKLKPGVSNALVNQVDLFASLARLTGQVLQSGDAPDSFDQLTTWLGQSKKGRGLMLEEAFTLALRKGGWKYIAPVTKEPPAWFANKKIASGLEQYPQLFNLQTDAAEAINLAGKEPQKLKTLEQALQAIKAMPTRPGYKKP